MLEELASFPEGTRYTAPEGGLFIFVEMPGGFDATALFSEAVERGVAYVPGTHFYPDGGHHNTLRLNFSNSTPSRFTRAWASCASSLPPIWADLTKKGTMIHERFGYAQGARFHRASHL